jgi:hypothetical protein
MGYPFVYALEDGETPSDEVADHEAAEDLVEEGTLTDETMCWNEDMDGWTEWAKCKGQFGFAQERADDDEEEYDYEFYTVLQYQTEDGEPSDEMTAELAKLAPNLKAVEQYEALKERERVVLEELDTAKEATRAATEAFQEVKTTRSEAFMKAFNHIADHIDPIYKELTIKPGHGIGGTAYLTCVFAYSSSSWYSRIRSPCPTPALCFLTSAQTSAPRGKPSGETWSPSSAESGVLPCGVCGGMNKKSGHK